MTNEEAIEVIKQDIPCEHDADLIEALDMAIKAIEQTTWIPVSERLPEDSGKYVVSVIDEYDKNYNNVVEAWFAHKKDYDIKESEWRALGISETVIAWMPLPEPYKGE